MTATGATSMTCEYHDKTVSMHKKPCCVRNENLKDVVFKNSYVTDDDDENYPISNPFVEHNRSYNSEIETDDFEFNKIT